MPEDLRTAAAKIDREGALRSLRVGRRDERVVPELRRNEASEGRFVRTPGGAGVALISENGACWLARLRRRGDDGFRDEHHPQRDLSHTLRLPRNRSARRSF